MMTCQFLARRSVWVIAVLTFGCATAQPEKSPDERAASIERGTQALRLECQQVAAGDWDRWERQTEPFRAALRKEVDSLKRLPVAGERFEPLAGRDDFPLFEVDGRDNLIHLYDPASLNSFRKSRAVEAASRWLKARGIDLIFVPIPKMTEVYIEHFLDQCPADGVIAPHLRRTLLELLAADVEVVDSLPLLRSHRRPDPDYLYNTADTHWAPRAQGIVARALADRIARYGFAAHARAAPAIVRASSGRYAICTVPAPSWMEELPTQQGWDLLTDDQKKRAARVQTRTQDHVTLPDGSEPPDDAGSPVLLMGHSYVLNFREHFIQALNLLVRTRWSAGQTTEPFADFVRDPSLLDGVRVVVWITTEQHLTHFKEMPQQVLKALETGN
jgi:hypothetical protein